MTDDNENENKKDPHPFDRILKSVVNKTSLSIFNGQLKDSTFNNLVSKPIEFSTVTKKADFVYEFWKQNDQKIDVLDTVFHLEAQIAAETYMLQRMLLYAGLIGSQYAKDKHTPKIKQIVLYLGRENNVVFKQDFGYFNYKYKVIYIKNIDYRKFLEDPNTLILAIAGKYDEGEFFSVLKKIIQTATIFFKDNLGEMKDFLTNLEKFGILLKLRGKIYYNIKDILKTTIMALHIDEIMSDMDSYKEGEKKGKLEGKLEDVKAMLLDKLPIEQIARYTGLTVAQIKKVVV